VPQGAVGKPVVTTQIYIHGRGWAGALGLRAGHWGRAEPLDLSETLTVFIMKVM